MMKTKIIATISKINGSAELLEEMLKAGASIFRINMSHSSHAEALELMDRIKSAKSNTGLTCEIMLDLSGPELRLLGLTQPLKCNKKTELTLYKNISLSLPDILPKLTIGSRVLLHDGKFEGEVVYVSDKQATLEVRGNGLILPNAHISFPDVKYGFIEISEKDIDDLRFAVNTKADYLALSFIHSGNDVKAYRKQVKLTDQTSMIKLLPKFESNQSLKNIDEIIEAGDCLFVARGDMGTENPPEMIPYYQKLITHKCLKAEKSVFIATQMLSTMEENPLPTRAEISDIANAVLDGASALTLSGETAIGRYPLESVKQMKRIAEEAEKYKEKLWKTTM